MGAWVFISAFVWPHMAAEQANTWILGVLVVLASIWAMFVPPVRFLNTLFSIWLFFATIAIPHSHTSTLWSNLIAAIIVFVMSLIPSNVAEPTGTRRTIPVT